MSTRPRRAAIPEDRHRRAVAERLVKAGLVVKGDPIADARSSLTPVGVAFQIDVLFDLLRPPRDRPHWLMRGNQVLGQKVDPVKGQHDEQKAQGPTPSALQGSVGRRAPLVQRISIGCRSSRRGLLSSARSLSNSLIEPPGRFKVPPQRCHDKDDHVDPDTDGDRVDGDRGFQLNPDP